MLIKLNIETVYAFKIFKDELQDINLIFKKNRHDYTKLCKTLW
jgi:hypothetical protein